MAGRRKKSKKRSAANSKRPELVIFLDRNLGRTVVAERLRREGARVEIHDDHFPDQRTPDEAWLRFAGQRGWVVITPDARIRYRANEKAAVESARVRQFVLTARGLDRTRDRRAAGESLAEDSAPRGRIRAALHRQDHQGSERLALRELREAEAQVDCGRRRYSAESLTPRRVAVQFNVRNPWAVAQRGPDNP